MAEDADMQPKAGKSQESDYEARSQSDSESQSSGTASSVKAKQPAGETRLNMAGSNVGTKKMTRKKDKKKGRRIGGVEKRRMTRRPRRKPKRKAPRDRVFSTSSIYAGRPSSSSLVSVSGHICKYCGHHRCLRRYKNVKRKRGKARKSPALRIKTAAETFIVSEPDSLLAGFFEMFLTVTVADEGAQAGSPAAMLSALFVKSSAPAEQKEGTKHCQITPEMIHLALKELVMWRQNVPTDAIFDYIMYNYPVNPNPEEAMTELHEKLHIASITGLVWALPDGCWRLTTPIERINKLEQSHVTVFWKVYADTMKPLDRKLALQLQRSNKETATYSKEQVDSGDADIV